MSMIMIGIDWSQDHHDVCLQNEGGGVLAQFRVSHSQTGLTQLREKINQLGITPNQCLVALETNHNILVDFLLAHQFTVYVLPPAVVKSCRGRFGNSGARTDQSDAHLLADILRTDRQRFTPWYPLSPLLLQMKVQISLIDDLTQDIVRYINRLQALLRRYYPQLLTMFSSLKTEISLSFLCAYPTPSQAQALSLAEFQTFCLNHKYKRRAHLVKRYAHLQGSYPPVAEAVTTAYQMQAVVVAELLLLLIRQKKQAIADTQRLFQQHPDQAIFASLPGAGQLLAPKLLVHFGEQRERFPMPTAVQQLAGTCPVTIASGRRRSIRFRRACNHSFRHTMQQFAQMSTHYSVWAEIYFQQARQRGKTKSLAYRCLANRWAKVIWTIWQRRTCYDESYHLAQVSQHRRA